MPDTPNNTQVNITRLLNARNTIRNKAVEIGIGQPTDKLDALATAIQAIKFHTAISATVKEGESYTIPAGYHNGSGVVMGVAGGGNYNLQSKTVTPTKLQQTVTSDEGYYGLSDVTVNAIPEAYQDTSAVTATAADVLATKIIVTAKGETVTGTMANNGTVSKTLDGKTTSFTIPSGFHDGKGVVKVVPEEKTVSPNREVQEIEPTVGKLLSKVTVNAIPSNLIDTTDSDATAEQVLEGSTAYVNGVKVTGSMPNVGSASKVLDTTITSFAIAEGYHDGTGTVTISTEAKTATPTKSEQVVSPTKGKVISKVTVAAIPENFIDTTDANATAAQILVGKTAYVKTAKVTGTMADNGDVTASMDGLSSTSVVIPAGYTSGGTITLTDDIANALAEI